MDGSTSTAPLAQAVASVLLAEPRADVKELAQGFSRTTQSFRSLMLGNCDILIVSEPVPEVFDELNRQGFKWEMAPIAAEALVFVVNANNPVDSLTHEELLGIYTGRITNWREVGGENAEIIAFQRNLEAGSQVLMEKLVMEGRPMMEPPMESIMYGMGDLIDAVKGFDGSADAIGYTVYYYAEEMRMAEGLKILKVGGVEPGNETIKSGKYPFLSPYYTVIGENEPVDSPARVMYNWLLSDEGQRLVEREGYVAYN
jgi:phosphate transport system substrate-binding protein